MPVRRSTELEEYAKAARKAFEDRDNDWFEKHTASGEVISFGTDPDEMFRGRAAVLALRASDIADLNESAGISFEFDETEGYEAGDAGWILTHGRFVLTDGTSIPVRGLTVVVREDGEWKSGVNGISVVVPNELLTPGSPLVAASVASGARAE
jgi:SnoaL-like domain